MYRFKANVVRFDVLAPGMIDELALLTKDVLKKFPHYRIYQRLDRPSDQFRLYIDHKEKVAVNVKDLVQICGHYERFFKKYYKTAVKLPLLIVDTEWKKCVSAPIPTKRNSPVPNKGQTQRKVQGEPQKKVKNKDVLDIWIE